MFSSPPFQVLLDFDGTLVEPNVAILLVERYCPGGEKVAHEIDLALREGRMTLRQAWKRQLALISPDQLGEMASFAAREVALRAGASELLRLLVEWSIPTSIVSGGLDFFIQPILDREAIRFPLFSDRLTCERNAGGLGVLHPFEHPTCRLCGICKAQVVLDHKSAGSRTVFIGDGQTDRFATEVSDIVFARHRLRTFCELAGIPQYPFETFDPVTRQLERWLTRSQPLPAPRSLGLSSSPCPISRGMTSRAVGSA